MARPKRPKNLKEADRIIDVDSQTPGSPERIYEIGYGKPPKHTRFRPGQSGNPRGKGAGTKSFKTLVERELDSTITIKTEVGTRKTTKREAAAKQVVNAAVKGDAKALKTLVDLNLIDNGAAAHGAAREPQLDERSRRVLEQVLEQAVRNGASTDAEFTRLQVVNADRTVSSGAEAEQATVPAPPTQSESSAEADAAVRPDAEGAGDG